MPKQPVTPEKTEPYVGKYQHVIGKKYTEDEIVMLADMLYDWMRKHDSNYYIMDFMTQPDIMLNRQRVSDFCRKNDYFNTIYNQCKLLQERRMFNLSLQADKPTAWIFALKNVANWRDNPEPIEDEQDDNELSFDGWSK